MRGAVVVTLRRWAIRTRLTRAVASILTGLIPDTAKVKSQHGTVIAIGPGARNKTGKLIPIDIGKGDQVLFDKLSGTEVKIDGDEILILNESDIMGVLNIGGRSWAMIAWVAVLVSCVVGTAVFALIWSVLMVRWEP